jgi:hypothetical protein
MRVIVLALVLGLLCSCVKRIDPGTILEVSIGESFYSNQLIKDGSVGSSLVYAGGSGNTIKIIERQIPWGLPVIVIPLEYDLTMGKEISALGVRFEILTHSGTKIALRYLGPTSGPTSSPPHSPQ